MRLVLLDCTTCMVSLYYLYVLIVQLVLNFSTNCTTNNLLYILSSPARSPSTMSAPIQPPSKKPKKDSHIRQREFKRKTALRDAQINRNKHNLKYLLVTNPYTDGMERNFKVTASEENRQMISALGLEIPMNPDTPPFHPMQCIYTNQLVS